MEYKYYVNVSRYLGYWEIGRGFETLDEAVNYIKQCQSNGYVIIDLQYRDF